MATLYWTGGASDSNWATAGNWTGNAAPNAADDVVLDNSILTSAYTVDLAGAATVNSVSIDNGNELLLDSASASLTTSTSSTIDNGLLRIESGSLTVSQNLTINSGGLLEIDLGGSCTVNQYLTVNSGGAVQIDGGSLLSPLDTLTIDGTLTGTGTLSVSGGVSGAGSITASGGSLTIASGSAFNHSNLVIADNSSLYLTTSAGVGASTAPALTFQGSGGLFQAINASIYTIYLGTISDFAQGDFINVSAFTSTDKLTYVPGQNTITISDQGGYNSRIFTFDSSATASEVNLSNITIGSTNVDELYI
jgi:filamentous hemagglutinin